MSVNASNNELGMKAPSFKLLNIDYQMLDLKELKGKNGTIIGFICCHCPYVVAIAERFSKEAKELSKFSINTIAIMSNDVTKSPDDSFDKMINFASKYQFNFPFLYDDTQIVAKKYGAVCTPDFFGFDNSLKLMYRGRIDSGVLKSEDNKIDRELYKAMIKIKDEGIAPTIQHNSFGCSIKWK